MMNKKGQAGAILAETAIKNSPTIIITIVLIAVLIIYLAMQILPVQFFPAIAQFRGQINYYLVVALWIIVQVGVVYVAYKGITLVTKAMTDYRNMLTLWTQKIKRFILLH